MNRKILLFDVDGTLISYDGIVPESTKQAIKLARNAGHLVYVVTGRTKNRATVGEIEVDGMICGNGAYIEASGVVLQDLKLSLEQTTKITDYLDERKISYFMEGNDGLYGSHNFEQDAIPTYIKYGIKNPVIKDLYPMMVFPNSMHIENITKINYLLHDYHQYLEFKEQFASLQCLTWGGKGEEALFGDCALPNIDKQNAIIKLIEYLKIEKEDIYAFGDAKVDIPMFNIAGTSICVGSGGQEAKNAASYVTDDVLDDGIYNALKNFNLL